MPRKNSAERIGKDFPFGSTVTNSLTQTIFPPCFCQVGTAVVTRPDGRLALGRLGSLCEQVEDLLSDGIEVILVSSGAVGVGRQKLRYQKMIHSTLKELHQMKKHEPDTKACAAIGQSGLMALYDALFGQVSDLGPSGASYV
jgi:glutamate 5-kinase